MPSPGRHISNPLIAFTMLLLAAGGCTPRYTDYSAFIEEPPPLVTSTDYRLAPPDMIEIYSKRVREFNGHREVIRPDGKITLPLVGSVFVAGKTPEEVSASLAEQAEQYYEDADVSLRIVRYASKKIYVFGEVGLPGPYAYDGTNTVLRTLATAHPTRLANPSRIQVLRPNADGELRRRMTIDLDQMVRNGDTSLNAVLEEGDIIYVPPSPLASVGLAIQQLLLPIRPAAETFRGASDIDTYAMDTQYGRNQ